MDTLHLNDGTFQYMPEDVQLYTNGFKIKCVQSTIN